MFRYIKIFQHFQLRKLKIKLFFHKKGLNWNNIKMICLGMSRHLRVVVVRYAPKKHKLLELFIDNLCTFDIFFIWLDMAVFFIPYDWVYSNKRMSRSRGERFIAIQKAVTSFFQVLLIKSNKINSVLFTNKMNRL